MRNGRCGSDPLHQRPATLGKSNPIHLRQQLTQGYIQQMADVVVDTLIGKMR
jgi:hypothetical protein